MSSVSLETSIAYLPRSYNLRADLPIRARSAEMDKSLASKRESAAKRDRNARELAELVAAEPSMH